ncbi:hypothetical protein BRC81_05585 [Halobacteriales archaeon QS_1_68_20]|nr:MAG: hypothetical protein BRC81_05585 [Halobacteriales archaeon QS_1_68_20]
MTETRSTHLRYPGGRKSLLGAFAYLAGYALVFAWKGNSIDGVFEQVTVESRYQSSTLAEALATADVGVSAVEGVGWLFYNAHYISVSVPTPAGGVTQKNLLSSVGGPLSFGFLVPPLLLLFAGLFATYGASNVHDLRFDLGDSAFVRYWYNGAFPVLFGYVPFATVGVVVSWAGGFGPDLLLGWVLAGMVYPFVFAGVGGLIGNAIWYESN